MVSSEESGEESIVISDLDDLNVLNMLEVERFL